MSEQDLIPFLSIFAGVVLVFLLVWFYAVPLLGRRRSHLEQRINHHAEDSSHSIVLDELPGEEPTGAAARFDRGFERLVARTGLDLTPAFALAIILFCGVLLGAFVFVWR